MSFADGVSVGGSSSDNGSGGENGEHRGGDAITREAVITGMATTGVATMVSMTTIASVGAIGEKVDLVA